MASSSTPHTVDQATEDEEDLSRVSVLIGDLLLDVGLPAGVSVSAVVNDVIELANDRLRARGTSAEECDSTEGTWTFARVGGPPIAPDQSLAEAGVFDGDLLIMRQLGVPASPLLVDTLADTALPSSSPGGSSGEKLGTTVWFAVAFGFSAIAALLRPALEPGVAVLGVPIGVTLLLAAGAATLGAATLSPLWSRDPRVSAGLAGIALPLLFGATLGLLPGMSGVAALATALSVTAVAALLQLLTCGTGRAVYTAVLTVAVLGVPAAAVQVLWDPNPRAVGAVLATVAVIVVYQAPRATIVLSGLPVPRVPTAGEPLDDIETEGGTAVEGVQAVGKQIIPTEEGMAERVRRARDRLTGIVTAAAGLACAGCYFAVDVSNGFFWQGTAFAAAVAVVLSLRGRSHHDLAQSAALIGGGLLITLMVIVKTAVAVPGFQTIAAAALVAVTVLFVVCGLVAPAIEFSPVMRRWAELGEYAGVVLIFPLACWIIRVYAFFREMRI